MLASCFLKTNTSMHICCLTKHRADSISDNNIKMRPFPFITVSSMFRVISSKARNKGNTTQILNQDYRHHHHHLHQAVATGT